MISAIKYSSEVAQALKTGKPIVALESTIISHGLPRPSNLEVAKECEAIVRNHGAVPATIALLDGKILIGLEAHELEAIANRDDISKASIRDLAIIIAQNKSAATTVAATAHIAAVAGIKVFATGGLGGVHRGASVSFDESADLTALSQLDMTVVCAGVKSILDVHATLDLAIGTARFGIGKGGSRARWHVVAVSLSRRKVLVPIRGQGRCP
jgi:pseudouridine-5'-phosphate glycosidase